MYLNHWSFRLKVGNINLSFTFIFWTLQFGISSQFGIHRGLSCCFLLLLFCFKLFTCLYSWNESIHYFKFHKAGTKTYTSSSMKLTVFERTKVSQMEGQSTRCMELEVSSKVRLPESHSLISDILAKYFYLNHINIVKHITQTFRNPIHVLVINSLEM